MKRMVAEETPIKMVQGRPAKGGSGGIVAATAPNQARMSVLQQAAMALGSEQGGVRTLVAPTSVAKPGGGVPAGQPLVKHQGGNVPPGGSGGFVSATKGGAPVSMPSGPIAAAPGGGGGGAVPAGGAPAPGGAPTAPPAATGAIDWNQLGQYMNDMTTKINQGMGQLGGGGAMQPGAARSRVMAAAGGGAAPGAAPQEGLPNLSSSQQELMKLDPRYQAELDALGTEAAGMQGKFLDLDEAAKADLATAKEAQLQRSRSVFNSQRDDLLTKLFAGGTNQSTIAGDMGGRIVADQALVEGDIEGQSADRTLAMRQALTDSSQKNLSLRADMARSKGDMALNELGINVDQLERGRDRDADIWKANLNSKTDKEVAGINASASAAAAGASAEASKFGSLVGLFGDQLRTSENARQFDAGLGLDRDRLGLDRDRLTSDNKFRQGELDLGRLKSDRDYDIGKRNVSVQRFGIQSENNRYNSGLAFDRERYAGDSAFRDRSFTEDTRRFDMGYGLDKGRLDLDTYIAQHNAKNQSRAIKTQQRGQLMSTAGSLIGAYMMSDVALKDGVQPVDLSERVEQLHGYSWVWKLNGAPSVGVLAQEVQKIFPEAVRVGDTGFLEVDYGYLTVLLLASHRSLLQKLEGVSAT